MGLTPKPEVTPPAYGPRPIPPVLNRPEPIEFFPASLKTEQAPTFSYPKKVVEAARASTVGRTQAAPPEPSPVRSFEEVPIEENH